MNRLCAAITFLCLSWLLAACDSGAAGPSLIPPDATRVAATTTAILQTAAQPSPTASATVVPTDSPTPASTATQAATNTLAPSATSSATSTATSPPANTPTRAASNTPQPSATFTRVPPTETPTLPPASYVPPPPLVQRLFVVPGNSALLFAMTSNNRFVRSDNGGASWSPVSFASTGLSTLTGIGIDYRNPRTIFLTGDKGIFRSDDQGQNWTLVNSLAGQGITVSLDDSHVLWTGVTDGRFMQVMRSTDAGKTWSPASNGFSGYILSGPILIDPQDTNTLYAVTDGLRGGQTVLRGTRDGAWQAIPSYTSYGFCCFMGIGLAWSTHSHSLYAGSAGGKLFVSTNSKTPDVKSVTWQTAADFGAQSIVGILAHNDPGETLYASVYDTAANKARLVKSPDGGASWQDLALP